MEYLNKKQAALRLSVSSRTLDRLRESGKISTYPISPRNLRFNSDEIDEYMRNSKEAT